MVAPAHSVLPVLGPDPRRILQHARPGPRYTSYPPVPAWSSGFGEDDYREALHLLAASPDDPVALYVHLPFCAERCAYCGCNATVTRHGHVVDRYLDRLEEEVRVVTAIVGTARRAVQVHWGGGTPNLLSPVQTVRLKRLLDDHFQVASGAEWSVEVDPRIADPSRMHLYGELGFNRVSLGVQDLDPRVQEAIGRIQPETLTRTVFDAARAAGFESINLDLVYGLPFQTSRTFGRTLETVAGWGPDRLACFGYAHLPHLRANQKRVDAREMPDAGERLSLFAQAVGVLADHGYAWIGLDHFARPSDPLAAAATDGSLHRNFMGYVVDPTPHLLAFGTSAIGEVAGRYVQNDAHLGRYERSVEKGVLPVVRGHRLSEDDRRRRDAINRILCTLRLPREVLPEEWRQAPDPWSPLRRFEADGMVEIDADEARVTWSGRFVLRTLCMTLDATLPADAAPRFSPTV
jgi:oxygen-independent coproporphyrinogen III oxidase